MIVLLFLAAVFGGALNAVAGGGSFLTLPALLYAGISPVAANATSTLALWPASVSSTFAYRGDLMSTRQWMLVLGAVSLLGGLAGSVLLVRTSDTSFMRLLPWLMLVAAATFTFGGRWRAAGTAPGTPHPFSRAATLRPELFVVVLLQFMISVYGGYFGGGMGIMMLATMAMAGMTNIHEMNGLKSMLGAAINSLALVTFVVSGTLAWRPGLVMAIGAALGGYYSASLARRIDASRVRLFVTVVGWGMTIYFFVK
jgi:uncharacterized protein